MPQLSAHPLGNKQERPYIIDQALLVVPRTAKIQANNSYSAMLINNIFNFYSNNGVGSYNTYSEDGEGFEFPKGSDHTVVFDEEFIWGGYVNNKFNVGGTGYGRLLQAGKIITPGGPSNLPVADDPALPKNRVYRVRPDINPAVPFKNVHAKLDSEEVKYLNRFNNYPPYHRLAALRSIYFGLEHMACSRRCTI